jgi:1-aminocyclopropane-1-carboxylate deaminase
LHYCKDNCDFIKWPKKKVLKQQIISPIHRIVIPELEAKEISLFIKREDLIHGACQGNKFRKLAYHLKELRQLGKTEILTFGGAFSNHIFAVAATGHRLGIKTIGLIRGEFDPNNPTLKMAREWGMQLQFLTRGAYRQRYDNHFIQQLEQQYPSAYIIPEGGSHPLAYLGLAEMVSEIRSQGLTDINHWVCPYASGGTAIGIAQQLLSSETLHAFVVLKGFDRAEAASIIPDCKIVFHEAHYGGFAKRSPLIEDFVCHFYEQHNIVLDPIYTGKMIHALFQIIRRNKIERKSKVLLIHTGGRQGIVGYNYLHGTDLPTGPKPQSWE